MAILRAIGFVLILVLGGACAPAAPPPPGETAVPGTAVVLTGTFHVVWGESATYLLTTDAGRTTTLVLDPELTRPLGGPQALDRRRVRITGRSGPGVGDTLHVTTLQLPIEGQ